MGSWGQMGSWGSTGDRRPDRAPAMLVPAQRYSAAVSIGTNPTFSGRTRTVEAFVLDVDADLYGQHVAVDFAVVRLRGQKKFDSVDDLIEAMGHDTERPG